MVSNTCFFRLGPFITPTCSPAPLDLFRSYVDVVSKDTGKPYVNLHLMSTSESARQIAVTPPISFDPETSPLLSGADLLLVSSVRASTVMS